MHLMEYNKMWNIIENILKEIYACTLGEIIARLHVIGLDEYNNNVGGGSFLGLDSFSSSLFYKWGRKLTFM